MLASGINPGFQLFETMLITHQRQVRHLERHLARLKKSAVALGFSFNDENILRELNAAIARITTDGESRLRLKLFHDGDIEIVDAPLAPLLKNYVDLLIEATPLNEPRRFSGHKITLREEYDAGTRRAEARGAFDSLFFTQDGRLVEGGRSNIFLQIDGHWWTPPLGDGPLPGVMRAVLLEDPAWSAGERTLRRADLRRASGVMICNALRGALFARLAERP